MFALLAVETSSNACSAALLLNHKQQSEITTRYEIAPRQHTLLLHEMMQDLLHEANVSLQQISAFAFGCGPGAFTGVRIATGVAKALAYSQDKPLITVSSLACLAYQAYREHDVRQIAVLNDARMGEIYAGAYSINQQGELSANCQEALLKPEQLKQFIEQSEQASFAIGNAWELYSAQLASFLSSSRCSGVDTESLPSAHDIALLAEYKYKLNQLDSAISAKPVYLRNRVAEKPSVI